MIVINGVAFGSGDFSPELSSDLSSEKMENKTIASDNIQVNPLDSEIEIHYTTKTSDEDFRTKKSFLEDLIYNRTIFSVYDSVQNTYYTNLALIRLGSFVYFNNGFSCSVGFKQANVTETSIPGKIKYTDQDLRNPRYTEKPLKTVTLTADSIPTATEEILEDMGIESINGVFEISALDVTADSIKDGISENVLSSLGGVKLNFDILPDGTMDILSSAGEYLVGGQKLLTNVEFLANMIPGVDFNMQLLPISQDVVNKVFDIEKLGTDYQIITNQISEAVDSLGN